MSDRDALRAVAESTGWELEALPLIDKFRRNGVVIIVDYEGDSLRPTRFHCARRRGDYGTIRATSYANTHAWLSQ